LIIQEGEEGDHGSPSKRQRLTPFQDITHISETVQGQTQDSNAGANVSATQVANMSGAELAAEIEKLRSALSDLKHRLHSTERDYAKLQHRYEAKHKLHYKTRQDLEAALEGSKKSAARLEKQKEEIMKLKEQKSELSRQLEEARKIIKEGGGPAADLELSQEISRKLTAENERLQRVVNSEKKQSEYTRQQYQNASSAAAQSVLELRQLEEENKELKRKASEEAARLKKLRVENDQRVHLERIAELEATLASRDQLLAKKEEEIVELRKNRHGTRSTSIQPRSPKFGASRPASPGPPNFNSLPRGSSALRFRAEP
jgi:chromosome segregation ATPase